MLLVLSRSLYTELQIKLVFEENSEIIIFSTETQVVTPY